MQTLTLENHHTENTSNLKQSIENELDKLDDIKLEQVYHYIKKLSKKPAKKNKAILLLKESGFIGCGEADPLLSVNYKEELKKILAEKHAHC
jgi:hypothetical protein